MPDLAAKRLRAAQDAYAAAHRNRSGDGVAEGAYVAYGPDARERAAMRAALSAADAAVAGATSEEVLEAAMSAGLKAVPDVPMDAEDLVEARTFLRAAAPVLLAAERAKMVETEKDLKFFEDRAAWAEDRAFEYARKADDAIAQAATLRQQLAEAERQRDDAWKALASVKLDCEICDWTCNNCGHDPKMTDTDVYSLTLSALAAAGQTEGTQP